MPQTTNTNTPRSLVVWFFAAGLVLVVWVWLLYSQLSAFAWQDSTNRLLGNVQVISRIIEQHLAQPIHTQNLAEKFYPILKTAQQALNLEDIYLFDDQMIIRADARKVSRVGQHAMYFRLDPAALKKLNTAGTTISRPYSVDGFRYVCAYAQIAAPGHTLTLAAEQSPAIQDIFAQTHTQLWYWTLITGSLIAICLIAGLKSARKLFNTQSSLMRAVNLANIGQITSLVAHEVRNPLGIIMGLAGTLKRQLKKHNLPTDNASSIEEEITHLNNVVENLLEKTRNEQAELFFPAISLKNIADRCMLDPAWKQTQLTLQLDTGTNPVAIPSVAAKQVFLNMLQNARKASGTDGKITLSCKNSKTLLRTPTVKITIQNSGPSPSFDIIKSFKTGQSYLEGSPTGFGIPLSVQLIKNSGGNIKMMRKNKMTQTVITLPAQLMSPGKGSQQ